MKTYYDIHCHIFNKNVIIRRLVNVVQSLLSIKDLLESEIAEEELKYKIDGINNILQDVTEDSSEKVFEVMNNVYKGNLVTTPLMFDLSYADDNDDDEHKNKRYRKRIKRIMWLLSIVVIPLIRSKVKRKFKNPELTEAINKIRENVIAFNKNFEKKSDKEVEIFDDANYVQQIEELEFLAKKNSNIKPFFSIDPRREYKGHLNLLEIVKQKVADSKGLFAGIKLYAPAGFSPTDPVLMGNSTQTGIYAFCEENKIPITVHNSNAGFACLSTVLQVRGHVYLNELVLPINKPITFHYKFFSLKSGEAIKERAKVLNHPKLWALVLNKYPNLTINFAHFGGAGQIMDYINYKIEATKIDTVVFEDRLLHIPVNLKETIVSAYTKKRQYMILRENLTISERAAVWNALYYAGLIDNWAKAIFNIIKNPKYPNAYTDLSCFSDGLLIKSPETNELTYTIKENLKTIKTCFFDKINDYEKSKIMYGSDFFLAQFFGPSLEQYFNDFKSAFGTDFDIIASDNPKRFLNIKT